MKSKHHEQIQKFIWNRKGKPFEFSKLKLAIHGYTAYGGKKYLVWLKKKYGLKEFKKGNRVWLQKVKSQEVKK